MNEHHLKKLSQDPALSLSREERSRMRSYLETLTAANPLPARAIPSPFFLYLARPMPLIALVLILAVSTSGVALAAENALPGEALYAIKVSVNEPFETYLAPTSAAKAEVQVRHAEERLREVEVLAAKGTLDEKFSERAALKVALSMNAASMIARNLAEKGERDASENIEAHIRSTLRAHAELLEAQSEGEEKDAPRLALRGLSSAITETADESEQEDVNEENDSRMLNAAKTRIERALSALEKRLEKDGVPKETEEEIRNELLVLEERFATAESSVEYLAVEKRAYRALALLTSAQNIGEATGKDVVVTFGSRSGSSSRNDVRAKGAATMMLMTSESAQEDLEHETEDSERGRDEDEEENEEDHSGSGKVEFRIRDRIEEEKE